ncbi:hypothetical protein Smp_114240 [Schistosoma mansoni]|uniref:hypothetical protein n=1 Tax=Schistosoma mansoni TaxID=6183 RepID=UPI00022DC955|nr:hypothetical protein Smp_114240 [Schistosoma mansoni]|eukprot:XP_018647625.1 hypothetical protein Smp_114240 [Schistosoma mansoni]
MSDGFFGRIKLQNFSCSDTPSFRNNNLNFELSSHSLHSLINKSSWRLNHASKVTPLSGSNLNSVIEFAIESGVIVELDTFVLEEIDIFLINNSIKEFCCCNKVFRSSIFVTKFTLIEYVSVDPF